MLHECLRARFQQAHGIANRVRVVLNGLSLRGGCHGWTPSAAVVCRCGLLRDDVVDSSLIELPPTRPGLERVPESFQTQRSGQLDSSRHSSRLYVIGEATCKGGGHQRILNADLVLARHPPPLLA